MTDAPTTHARTSLAGKRIVVTGGTTGIGRAIARDLSASDARVLICGRHDKELNDALADMTGEVQGVVTDLSTQGGVTRLFAHAARELGEVDILVCNAALAVEGVGETDPMTIEYVVRTNLLGYLLCTRQVLDQMKSRKAGHIVFIGSMSADVRDRDESVYAATKSGIQGFAESLRKEVNQQGVRISLIQPGSVGTDMQPEKETHEQQQRELKMLKAEDIASCVHFCLTQPLRCDIVSLDVRPHLQII